MFGKPDRSAGDRIEATVTVESRSGRQIHFVYWNKVAAMQSIINSAKNKRWRIVEVEITV